MFNLNIFLKQSLDYNRHYLHFDISIISGSVIFNPILAHSFSVILIDKVDDDFYHCVLLFGATLSYHEGKGNQCFICDMLGAIFIGENT